MFHTDTHQIMEPENGQKKIESTEKSEDTVKNGGNKFIAVLKNITIEPAIFLLMLSGGLDDPLIPQFIITKICSYDFGYNETVCDDKNLVTDYQEENDEIQKEVCFTSNLMLLACHKISISNHLFSASDLRLMVAVLWI